MTKINDVTCASKAMNNNEVQNTTNTLQFTGYERDLNALYKNQNTMNLLEAMKDYLNNPDNGSHINEFALFLEGAKEGVLDKDFRLYLKENRINAKLEVSEICLFKKLLSDNKSGEKKTEILKSIINELDESTINELDNNENQPLREAPRFIEKINPNYTRQTTQSMQGNSTMRMHQSPAQVKKSLTSVKDAITNDEMRKIELPDDGACMIRGLFLLTTKDSKFIKMNKSELLNEINNRNLKQIFIDSIDQGLKNFVKIYRISEDPINTHHLANEIYTHTIEKNAEFTLYSPIGILSAIGEINHEMATLLTGNSPDEADVLADCIALSIRDNFFNKYNTNKKTQNYLKYCNNHYNIEVPCDFFLSNYSTQHNNSRSNGYARLISIQPVKPTGEQYSVESLDDLELESVTSDRVIINKGSFKLNESMPAGHVKNGDQGITNRDGTINSKAFEELIVHIREFVSEDFCSKEKSVEAIKIVEELNKKIQTGDHLKRTRFGSIRKDEFDPASFRDDLKKIASQLLSLDQKNKKNCKNNEPSNSRLTQLAYMFLALRDYHVWYSTENQRSNAALNAAEKWALLEKKTPGTEFTNTVVKSVGISGGVDPMGVVSIDSSYTRGNLTSLGTEHDGSPDLLIGKTHEFSLGASAKGSGAVNARGKASYDVGVAHYSKYNTGINHLHARAYAIMNSKVNPANMDLLGPDSKRINENRNKFLDNNAKHANISPHTKSVNLFKSTGRKIDEWSASSAISPNVIGHLEEGTIFVAAGSLSGRTAACIIDKDERAERLKEFIDEITSVNPVHSGFHSKAVKMVGSIKSSTWGAQGSLGVGNDWVGAGVTSKGDIASHALSFYLPQAPHNQISLFNKDPELKLGWKYWCDMLDLAPQLKEYCAKYTIPATQDINNNFKKLNEDFNIYSVQVDRLAASTAAILKKKPLAFDINAMMESMIKLKYTFNLDFSLPSEGEIKTMIKEGSGTKDLSELAYAIIGESFAAISMAAAAVTLQEDTDSKVLDKVEEIKASIDRCDFKSIDASIIHGFNPLLLAKEIVTNSKSISGQIQFNFTAPDYFKFGGIEEVEPMTFLKDGTELPEGKGVAVESPEAIATIKPLGASLGFSVNANWKCEWYNRTHINPIRAGQYTKQKIDVALGISGYEIETIDALVKSFSILLSNKINKTSKIPEQDRNEMVKQMQSSTFSASLKELLCNVVRQGNGLPRTISISFVHESHTVCPQGDKKTAYSQFFASVEKGYGFGLDTKQLGNRLPVNVNLRLDNRDTFSVASPLNIGSDLLMHALRFSEDVQPCMDVKTFQYDWKQKRMNAIKDNLNPEAAEKLQSVLFSQAEVGLLNLLEEASTAYTDSPLKNTFSWLLQEKKISENGTVEGFIDKDLRDFWFESLSPFISDDTRLSRVGVEFVKAFGDKNAFREAGERFEIVLKIATEEDREYFNKNIDEAWAILEGKTSEERLNYFMKNDVGQRLMRIYEENFEKNRQLSSENDRKNIKNNIVAARAALIDKTPEERLNYFKDDDLGRRLMDQYIQVIEFMRHCAGLASIDSELTGAWKHVESASNTITPTIKRHQMKGAVKRAKEQLKGLNLDELTAITKKTEELKSQFRDDPDGVKSVLRNLKRSGNSTDQRLAKIVNSKNTALPKLLDKLDAIEIIAGVEKVLPKSMKNPLVQKMLKRLDDRSWNWDKDFTRKARDAANEIRGQFEDLTYQKTLNLGNFISNLNGEKSLYKNEIAKIMNSSSGGVFRSPESWEKFEAKLDALCDAIELKITQPMAGSKFR